MAKVTLRATGGLNVDVDPNNLPEGDYVSANNIIFDGGKDGGAGAIKMLDSITQATGIGTISGTIKATYQNADGYIYVLAENGTSSLSTSATIYRIPTTLDSKTAILTYTHFITTDFVPDLRVIKDILVWNYAETGTILSFCLTDRTLGNTYSTLDNLRLQKTTPNNVATIKKATSGNAIEFMESNDFQFAFRYQYDTGEYSVLGNYSQMFKGEKGCKGYFISYNFTGRPTFTSYIESYVRIGNNGTWRRIDTISVASNVTDKPWTGEIFESLDAVTTGKPFDSVPISAKHIEIAKNRIFLANLTDDYFVSSANLDFTLSTSTESALGAGTYNSYVGNNVDANSSETSYTGTDYVKPFANNSTYGIGLAYYDAALKTRGVEKYIKFTTGKFTLPLIPNVSIVRGSSYQVPSWAKYAQLVYTKNISKAYVYEGYASNIFFELTLVDVNETTKETTETTTYSQNVTKDQLKNVKYFVVDLMGMFRAGNIYTFQAGDRITIKTPLTTPADGILDLKIVGQSSSLIYCEYSGGAMTNLETPDPSTTYFEIYTPKQSQDDESLLFYEYGSLMPISGWTANTTTSVTGAGTINSDKLIGDMVYQKLELPVYSTAPFLYNTQKTSPAVITEDVITVINAMTSQTMTQSLNNAGAAGVKTLSPQLTIPSGTNGDGATVLSTGDTFKIANFYEIGNQDPSVNKLSLAFSLASTYTFTLGSPISPDTTAYGSMTWTLTAQVYITPYNNKDNKYDATDKFGREFQVESRTVSTTTGSPTVIPITSTHEINLNTDIKRDISANDKFSVVLSLAFSMADNVTAGQVTIGKQSASTYGIVMTLNGDKTASKTITTYNPSAEVNATKVKFLMRSISNATANQQWNTSAGKPSFVVKDRTSTARPNTIRYGGNYVSGTRVNNVNSFFALDSNDVAVENGAITSLQRASRLQGNGSMMLVLCEKESAYIMLGEQELSQGNNSSIQALTANMIGTIRNFGNNLGMLTKPSVMNYKGFIWWWDDFNKKIVQYSPDGLQIKSDIFARSFFRNKSGVATFSYDPFHNMAFVSIGSDTQSMGFSDNLNRWIGAYDFVVNFAESYGDKMVLFKSGNTYLSLQSNNKTSYNSFLGNAAVDANISFMLNSRLPVNPLNVAVWHDMNVLDYTKAADTNGEFNYVKTPLLQINISNENGQATTINENNFLVEDNRLYAHVMRDTNTPSVTNPLIEGNYIVGFMNKFTIVLRDKTQNMRINSIDVDIAEVSGHS